MAVKYLAGDRLQGTAAERTALVTGGASGVPMWKELARMAGTAAENKSYLETATFTAKPFLMILMQGSSTTGEEYDLLFNADTGGNYTNRQSTNGGSDGQGSFSKIRIGGSGGSGSRGNFNYAYFNNVASREKIGTIHGVWGATGTGGGITRTEVVGKWTNTSDQITSVRFGHENRSFNGVGGSEVVVLGYDPADTTAGAGFWEELASVAGDGSSTTLTTGTFTAKKYLRFSSYTTAFLNNKIKFNEDAGTNYSRRYTGNGAGNATSTAQSGLELLYALAPAHVEGIMLNVASLEKNGIVHTSERNTAGAGAALNRSEQVIRWSNTSDQITRIDLTKTGTNFGTNETLKVWGSN